MSGRVSLITAHNTRTGQVKPGSSESRRNYFSTRGEAPDVLRSYVVSNFPQILRRALTTTHRASSAEKKCSKIVPLQWHKQLRHSLEEGLECGVGLHGWIARRAASVSVYHLFGGCLLPCFTPDCLLWRGRKAEDVRVLEKKETE